MVTIEEARLQVEAGRQQADIAQQEIQSRQIALPETRTQRALRAVKGIAGTLTRQRVQAARGALTEQQKDVEQYRGQLKGYEEQITEAEAKQVVYESQKAAYDTQRAAQQKEVAEWKQAEHLAGKIQLGQGGRYDPRSSVGRKINAYLDNWALASARRAEGGKGAKWVVPEASVSIDENAKLIQKMREQGRQYLVEKPKAFGGRIDAQTGIKTGRETRILTTIEPDIIEPKFSRGIWGKDVEMKSEYKDYRQILGISDILWKYKQKPFSRYGELKTAPEPEINTTTGEPWKTVERITLLPDVRTRTTRADRGELPSQKFISNLEMPSGSGTVTRAVDIGGGMMQDFTIKYKDGEVIDQTPLNVPVPQSRRFKKKYESLSLSSTKAGDRYWEGKFKSLGMVDEIEKKDLSYFQKVIGLAKQIIPPKKTIPFIIPSMARKVAGVPEVIPSSKLITEVPGAVGTIIAEKIPDYGPGIKISEARIEPAKEFVEKASWVPEFGTYVPEEYKVKEYRPTPERRYKPKYIFGSKRVKEAVEFGVPLGVGLAAWQYVPAKLVAPTIGIVSGIEVVGATKEISELKKQKIDVSQINKDIGERPANILSEDWATYRKEYIAEIEKYNKEIEAAIKSQRISQAIGVAGVGVATVIGGKQIFKYAKQPIVKVLPSKIPKPVGIEKQIRVADPMTGKIITTGKYEIPYKIPAKKALVQKRWEKWVGREPKLVELTKPKVKYQWTPETIIEGKPGLVYETRAVKPETLTKFKAGKTKLFVKPRIIGGPSAPTSLAEFKKMPKATQEMWRRMASEYTGTTISLKRTPSILKKIQKVSGETITYSPLESLGRRTTRAATVTTVEPITTITRPSDFGIISTKISKEAPVELFKAETIAKDITKATGTPSRVVGKMPGLEMKIIRLKKVISADKPSKTWGVTSTKIKKTPLAKTFQVAKMVPPTPLPKPSAPIIRAPSPKVITAPIKPSVVAKTTPSVWAGRGVYERTEIGIGARPIVGISSIPKKEARTISRLDVGFIPAQILTPILKPSVKVKERAKLKLKTIPLMKTIIKVTTKPVTKTITKPAFRLVTKPITKPITKTITRTITKPIVRTVTRPGRPSPPAPRIPKIIYIPKTKPKIKVKRNPSIKLKPRPGYEVEVKRKGKWVDVTPFAISKKEALALGRRETKAGAEVTFRLKEADGIEGSLGLMGISEAELKKEYRGRIIKGKEVKEPLTFIQKRKFRIATPGEFLAITTKGIAKRKSQVGGALTSKARARDVKWI